MTIYRKRVVRSYPIGTVFVIVKARTPMGV